MQLLSVSKLFVKYVEKYSPSIPHYGASVVGGYVVVVGGCVVVVGGVVVGGDCVVGIFIIPEI